MEFGRFKQVNDLREKGWTDLHDVDFGNVCGGPSYMVNPEDNLTYFVSCGIEKPLTDTLKMTDGRSIRYENGVII